MKIRKGDNVKVISGKDKGKTGKVTRVLSQQDRIIIEGVNMKKRHQKPRKARQKGQIVEFASPIHVSNAMVIDPKNEKPTRIGYRLEKDKKIRYAKKSGAVIKEGE